MIGGVSHDSDAGAPAGLDTAVANVARVYDYMLGGKDNFAADRDLGDQLLRAFPDSAWIARQNRRFLGRAVRYCAQQGLGQFLDLGSGLPTMDNVHEVARRVIPGAAVVYVDNDRVALTHANALLATSDGVAAVFGGLREPGKDLGRRRGHRRDRPGPAAGVAAGRGVALPHRRPRPPRDRLGAHRRPAPRQSPDPLPRHAPDPAGGIRAGQGHVPGRVFAAGHQVA